MLDWLKPYLGLDAPYKKLRTQAKLSEDEARVIAELESGLENLIFAELVSRDDSLIWSFRTPTIGSWSVVRLDDATGKLLCVERQGKR